jgi:hypothetical protein
MKKAPDVSPEASQSYQFTVDTTLAPGARIIEAVAMYFHEFHLRSPVFGRHNIPETGRRVNDNSRALVILGKFRPIC